MTPWSRPRGLRNTPELDLLTGVRLYSELQRMSSTITRNELQQKEGFGNLGNSYMKIPYRKARLREARNGGVPGSRPQKIPEKSIYSRPLKTAHLLDIR